MRDRIRVLCALGSMGGGGSERQMLHLLTHLDRSQFEPVLYLVYRSGELLPEIPAWTWRGGAGRFVAWKRRLLRKAYQQATRVVAVSEDLRRRAMAYYQLDPRRIVTVTNPIDLERAARLAAVGDPGFAADRFHVVCAGRLQPEKGYPYLLQAIDELVHHRGRTTTQAHVLGKGPQEHELRRFVEQRRLHDHVLFEGFQQNPFCFFRAAHVVCLPSVFEGMPNVLLEAMACGTPVLATDCPSGPRELLGDGRYGRLVPPANAAALAAALDDALTGYERWQALVPAARARLEERHSLADAIRSWQTLLHDAARGSGMPRRPRGSLAPPH